METSPKEGASEKEDTTMTIKEGSNTYRLPLTTTQENLEGMWSTVLAFGDRIIMAGYYWHGWFAAVYEFTTEDHSCESEIALTAVSEDTFEDNGHAIAWAMQN